MLTPAQVNYSQIDKEAAAIIFRVTKFYDYLYGREFVLRTDNQPLVRIFGNNKGIPKMAASRLIRWSLFLSAFQYKIEYINTKKNSADWLSRVTNEKTNKDEEQDIEYSFIHYVAENEISSINCRDIVRETRKDKTL